MTPIIEWWKPLTEKKAIVLALFALALWVGYLHAQLNGIKDGVEARRPIWEFLGVQACLEAPLELLVYKRVPCNTLLQGMPETMVQELRAKAGRRPLPPALTPSVTPGP